MKNFRILLLFTFLAFTMVSAETSIAVLNLKSSKVGKEDLIAVTNYVTTELSKIAGYRVIAWDDVEKMLEHEAGKQLLGCDDEKCIAEIGGALGVDYIMAGDIGGLGTRFVCNLKIIDINKAETKSRVSETVTGDIGLVIDKIPNMVRRLLSRPLAGSTTISTGKVPSVQNGSTVTDIDGNVYNTVRIGNQVWAVENLRTTKYNDGTSIPNVTSKSRWADLNSGAYCYYDNSTSNKKKYGALYNWYAVNTGKLAPAGWHVPTDEEWQEMEDFLIANGYNWDGTKSKDKTAKSLASKTGWKSSSDRDAIGNDMSSNNRSGFSALPGGYRNVNGLFYSQGYDGSWWSATEDDASNAYARDLYCNYGLLNRYNLNKECGFSVRLVRD